MKIRSYRSVWDAVADSPEEAAHLKLRGPLADRVRPRRRFCVYGPVLRVGRYTGLPRVWE